jgi:hypothetical protein
MSQYFFCGFIGGGASIDMSELLEMNVSTIILVFRLKFRDADLFKRFILPLVFLLFELLFSILPLLVLKLKGRFLDIH